MTSLPCCSLGCVAPALFVLLGAPLRRVDDRQKHSSCLQLSLHPSLELEALVVLLAVASLPLVTRDLASATALLGHFVESGQVGKRVRI